MKKGCLLFLFAAMLLATSLTSAFGQEDYWKLDNDIEKLTEREVNDLKRLPDLLKDLPLDVLKAFLKDEGKHIESITEPQLDSFVGEAKARFKAHGARHLMANLKATFSDLKITSKRVLAIVYKEELKRLNGMPDDLLDRFLAEAVKRVLGDRLKRLSHIKLDVVKANESLNSESPRYSWQQGEVGAMGRDSKLVQDLVLMAKEDKFVKTLFEREVKGEFGTLKLTGAKLEGLAKTKVGKLSYKDAFGRIHEGLGATFQAKTKFTVVNADAQSKKLELLKDQPINISAMIFAKVIDMTTNAELNSTNLVTTDGLILHNEVKAGATVSASVRVPLDIDLKLFKVRITPYASAHAGVGAEAHANIEIEWTGRIAIDVGAAYSLGAGVGGGVRLELMAGPIVQKILDYVAKKLKSIFRPILDSLRGIHEPGPAFESGKKTFGVEELSDQLGDTDRSFLPAGASAEAVAKRYAPVIYQRVKNTPHDYIRRVDFDGDFNGMNNWNNSGSGDTKAHVYWDVKETKTHYFINYSWYYARRESRALLFLRYAERHENDFGGVTVVVRKNADRWKEIEMLLSASGERMHAYSQSKQSRWRKSHGPDEDMSWSGVAKFVDEVDHPFFDRERTHPQLYSKARSHDVGGYNGRDDRDGFEGEDGVVYYHTGTAESPSDNRDRMVGYKLLPLSDLMKQIGNKKMFANRTVTMSSSGMQIKLPVNMRGGVGPDDQAILPWAWSHVERNPSGPRDRDHDREVEVIAPGALYASPARTISRLFQVNGPWSYEYLRNDVSSILKKKSIGATGALDKTR